MDRLPPLCRDAFIEKMRSEVERVLGEVTEAVNQAPTGRVITTSEEKVRDVMADLRRIVYETAVQMRVDEGEKSFSPSEGCGQWPEQAKQGV
jgi:hypothetical protein